MNDERIEELKDPNEWDFESAEVHRPVKKPRAIVSVAFPREDFELVSERASQLGMKTSEFIRVAAIEKASVKAEVYEMAWHGGSSVSFFVMGNLSASSSQGTAQAQVNAPSDLTGIAAD